MLSDHYIVRHVLSFDRQNIMSRNYLYLLGVYLTDFFVIDLAYCFKMFKKPYYFDAFKILPLNLARLLCYCYILNSSYFSFFQKWLTPFLHTKNNLGVSIILVNRFLILWTLLDFWSTFWVQWVLVYVDFCVIYRIPSPHSLWMAPFIIFSVNLLPAIYRNSIFGREQNLT